MVRNGIMKKYTASQNIWTDLLHFLIFTIFQHCKNILEKSNLRSICRNAAKKTRQVTSMIFMKSVFFEDLNKYKCYFAFLFFCIQFYGCSYIVVMPLVRNCHADSHEN